jgi:two-component system invasion response regulator UvrY
MIKVLMADDHPLLREGLKHILQDCTDMVFAGEVDNGFALIEKLRTEAFDVLLLDLFMPGKSGIELINQIKIEYPKLPILVLSTHKEDLYAMRTLRAGASGYLCKDYAATDLVLAIRKVAMGGHFISETVADLMARELNSPVRDKVPHTLLSNREYQIFMMIASGMGITEIANQLCLSVKTVSTHKSRIMEKMQLAKTADLVRYAVSKGLIPEIDDTPSSAPM